MYIYIIININLFVYKQSSTEYFYCVRYKCYDEDYFNLVIVGFLHKFR